MGRFIAVVHNNPGCNNDWGVQEAEEVLFDGQPSLSWRGHSHAWAILLFDEYLQFCYFMLYLCVAGIPFGFWLMGYFGTRQREGTLSSSIASPTEVSSPTAPSDSPVPSEGSDSAAAAPSPPSNDAAVAGGATPPAMFTPITPVGNGWVAQQRAKLVRDPWYAFDLCICALLIASYSCWVIYFIHPVAGPLWCFPRPDPSDTGFFFSYVNAKVQDNGAAHGTATPSSHCASTVCLWILCMIFNRHMAITGAFFVPGLVWATFYLQYHYLIDAIAGTAMGIMLPFIAIKATDALRGFLHGPQWIVGQPPAGSAAAIGYGSSDDPDALPVATEDDMDGGDDRTLQGTAASPTAADDQSLLVGGERSEDHR